MLASTSDDVPTSLYHQGDPACFPVQPHTHLQSASQSQRAAVPKVPKEALSYDEFCESFMSCNLPVIIKGIADDWNITKRWVRGDGSPNLEAICQVAATSEVFVMDARRELKGEAQCVTMSVEEYCRWWADHKAGIGKDAGQLLYLKDWHFLHEHPEFQAYQLPQYFSDDWLNEYYDHVGVCRMGGEAGTAAGDHEPSAQAAVTSDYRFVYLGPQGSFTALHADVLRSFSWSANIAGRKRWRLLPPEHTWLLYDTTLTQLAPDFYLDGLPDVNPADFPGLEAAQQQLIEVIQEPGEAIFVPACWHHTVENLEDALSLNHNWFNAASAPATWAFLKRQRDLAEASISDCRELCSSEEEFQDLVQKLLASNAGLGLASWVELLRFVVVRDCGRLQRAAVPSGTCGARRRALASLGTCGRLLQELLLEEQARCMARSAGTGSRSNTGDSTCSSSKINSHSGTARGSGRRHGMHSVHGVVAGEQMGVLSGAGGPWQPGYATAGAALLLQVEAALKAAGSGSGLAC